MTEVSVETCFVNLKVLSFSLKSLFRGNSTDPVATGRWVRILFLFKVKTILHLGKKSKKFGEIRVLQAVKSQSIFFKGSVCE